jgi:RHS repeat-associated protein
MKARYTISILLLLLSFATDGKQKIFEFEYDGWGNLSKTVFEDGKSELCNPDKTGNLFESLDRLDRKYAQGGQLLKTADWEYKYDREGNLVRKKDKHGATWRYEWNEAGMLAKVKRPDSAEVSFKYDALGRRISKRFRNIITRWTWDGNVPLHEQKTQYWRDYEKERGEFFREDKQPLVTWVFEEGTFVPVARITEKQQLSIVTNYLGTPEAMYREDGEAVWTCELNSYGKVRNFQGEFKTDCPFRYQGQYEDSETGLFYNRFRYYSPEEGGYLSQDPIGLDGGISFYSYVFDTNNWIDIFGLQLGGSYGKTKSDNKGQGGQSHHMPSNSASRNAGSGITEYSGPATYLSEVDHKKTASYGRGENAQRWRNHQEDLIKRGKFGKAMEMDIRDVKRKFGNKYNAGMSEMIDYAKGKGQISETEGRRLKRKYCN